MDTKMLLKLLENQADPAKVSAMEAYMKINSAFLAFKNQFSKRLKESFLSLS